MGRDCHTCSRWATAPLAASPASFHPSKAATRTGFDQLGRGLELDHRPPPDSGPPCAASSTAARTTPATSAGHCKGTSWRAPGPPQHARAREQRRRPRRPAVARRRPCGRQSSSPGGATGSHTTTQAGQPMRGSTSVGSSSSSPSRTAMCRSKPIRVRARPVRPDLERRRQRSGCRRAPPGRECPVAQQRPAGPPAAWRCAAAPTASAPRRDGPARPDPTPRRRAPPRWRPGRDGRPRSAAPQPRPTSARRPRPGASRGGPSPR